MTGRIGYIDALKGIAMIMVVCGHLILFCGLGDENEFIRHIVLVNMPLFFCLNGLVVSYKPVGIIAYGRKLLNLFVPFFCWGGLISLYRSASYVDFLIQMYHFGYWYLLVLVELKVAFYVFYVICKKAGRYSNIVTDSLLILSVAFIVRYSGKFLPEGVALTGGYWFFNDYFIYFFFGALIKKYGLLEKIYDYRDQVMAVTTVLLIPFYVLWSRDVLNDLLVRFFVLDFIVWLVCLMSIIYHTESDQGKTRTNWLCRIGENTLVIYMAQFFLFRCIHLDNVYAALYGSGNNFALLLITVAIAIAICYFCMGIGYVVRQSRILSFLLLGQEIRIKKICRV